jgi:hypothetical protein
MQFHPDFAEFLMAWKTKADSYDSQTLAGMYDKFFTLFVIYNRLYAMATFCLWSEGEDEPNSDNAFPDTKAATQNLACFLGPSKLMRQILGDQVTGDALQRLQEFLRTHEFHFKLKLPYADADNKADERLLRAMQSSEDCRKARAMLELLHCVRCNMFHGSKSFHPVQEAVLRPITVILEKVIQLTVQELRSRNEPVRPIRTV